VLGSTGVAHAESIQSDLVLIRAEDVIAEDLYAAGNAIQVAGTIQGDLVGAAMGEIRIDGLIEGDLDVVASKIVVNGVVEGSARLVAADIVIAGTIEGDVVTAAGSVSLETGGDIGRDVLAAAWRWQSDGAVGRDVEGIFRHLAIGGTVGQNVEVAVRQLTVGETATIEGDLAFRSSRDAQVAPGADVNGSTLARRPLSPNVRVTGLGLLIRFLLVLFGLALGLAMIWATGVRASVAAKVMLERPLAVVGQGVAVTAFPLLLIGGVVVAFSYSSPESAVPLLAVALPLLLAVVGVLAVVALVSPVPPAVAIGARIVRDRSLYAQFLVGYVALLACVLLPVVGSIVFVAVVVGGLGGWITTSREPEASCRRSGP
jgi:cytoskeletal protein CcmA (bactofilin family)